MTFAELSRTAQTVSAACLTLLAALSAATCAAEKPGQTACRTDSAEGKRNAAPPAAAGMNQPGSGVPSAEKPFPAATRGMGSATGKRNAAPLAAIGMNCTDTCAARSTGFGAKKPFHPTPAREACVKKRANGLLPAACGIILLALSFVLLTWIPPGTMEGSAMLCFALGTMVLFLPGRWTSALSPAAAVWIAHMSGIQPGALRLGAAAGLIAAAAAEWMLRRLASEECRGILRGLCGAAMYCLGAAACVLA